jgi:hypothetical protein
VFIKTKKGKLNMSKKYKCGNCDRNVKQNDFIKPKDGIIDYGLCKKCSEQKNGEMKNDTA